MFLDLLDNAQQELDQLRDVVYSAINTAHSYLDSLVQETKAQRDDKQLQTEVELDAEYDHIIEKLAAIKQDAGNNIDTCFGENEYSITSLPQKYRNIINSCLAPLGKDLDDIQINSNYTIDIHINEVESYAYQITLCKNEILCLTSLITKIAIATESIPAKVEIELNKASAQIDALEVPIGNCMNDSTNSMVLEANDLLDSISECISIN